MFCIKCHSPDTKVTNSRPHKKRASIWRRRGCSSCGAVFTTSETVATEGLLRVRDTRAASAPFSIGRLIMSIAPMLTQRSSAADDAYWLATTAYEQALASVDEEISPQALAQIVFTVIERYDSTAALKYALDHKLTRLPASRARRPRF